MSKIKEILEKWFPHKHVYQLLIMHGDFHEYYCKICDKRKYTLETDLKSEIRATGEFVWIEPTITELTDEEAKKYKEEAHKSIRATMWILDNVEPTASAGRDDNIDYKYKLKDGEIVEKDNP